MPNFFDLKFEPRSDRNGVRSRFTFPNGYQVSVIKDEYSCGGKEGLYELAVLHSGRIVYDTPVTDDVEGYLTEEQVSDLMNQVAALPERN